MLRRLISSLKTRFTPAPERDEAGPVDAEAAIDEARLRDQHLRNQAARSIGEKIVLRTRIQKTARVIGEATELARRALGQAGRARAADDEDGVMEWIEKARAHATRMQTGEGDLDSLRSRYREATTQAEAARDAIDENAMGMRTFAVGRQELTDVVDEAVSVMSTSIEDETPDPDTLDDEVERLRAEGAAGVGPGSDFPRAGRHERRESVKTAAPDAELEALRAELGL